MVITSRLAVVLLAGATHACAPAPGTDAATTYDAMLEAAAPDVATVADANDAGDGNDAHDAGGADVVAYDAPDCAFVCVTRQEYIDGSVLHYVEYGDGAISLDASCTDPAPSDPRCGFT